MGEKPIQPQSASLPKKFTVRVIDSPSKINAALSGAIGGSNPQGQLSLHLYTEYPAFAEFVSAETQALGMPLIQTPIEGENAPKFIREIFASITLDHNVAKGLGEWLISTSDIMKNQIAQAAVKK
jgi:hypothetical protein